MKTRIAILLLLASLPVFAANPLTNLLSLAYINGTNNGGVYYASNIIVPVQKFTVQSLGLTNSLTNSLTFYLQWSVDGSNTNWITLATYNPTTTNAAVESFTAVPGQIAIPMRVQVVTTNSIGASVFTSP